jgi:hypothetical protein
MRGEEQREAMVPRKLINSDAKPHSPATPHQNELTMPIALPVCAPTAAAGGPALRRAPLV